MGRANPTDVHVRMGRLEIGVATGFGPRIVGFAPVDGANLFAELGDRGIDLQDGRRFVFGGGHRLWLAPEVPETTYEPDDVSVSVEQDSDMVEVSGVVAGVRKTIRILPLADRSSVRVEHTIESLLDEPLEIAPWAITQVRPGGTALLPIGTGSSDPHGLQATSAVVGWPYTDWDALAADASGGVLHIVGERTTPTKVGVALERGWMAYVTEGWLFVKCAAVAPSTIDRGATGQVYACADFVELETLGSPKALAKGATVTHREEWHLRPAPGSLEEAAALAESLTFQEARRA